jgi:molybdenum cofactor guanylyltransferase
MPMITGVALAGGSSRRMGQDKALLRLTPDAPTFLERAAQTLEAVCGRVLIVAPHERAYAVDGVEFVADRWPGAGPVGGMLTALEAVANGSVLVLACDYPLVPSELLSAMIRERRDAAALIAMASGTERTHPLVGRYAVDYWVPLFREAVASGDWTLQRVLGRGATDHYVVDEARWGEGALLNVNTEDELVKARRLVR